MLKNIRPNKWKRIRLCPAPAYPYKNQFGSISGRLVHGGEIILRGNCIGTKPGKMAMNFQEGTTTRPVFSYIQASSWTDYEARYILPNFGPQVYDLPADGEACLLVSVNESGQPSEADYYLFLDGNQIRDLRYGKPVTPYLRE